MLKIEVSALHPDEAKGLSIPQQVEMALSGIGFIRHLLGGTAGLTAPLPSISSTDDLADQGEDQVADLKADATAPAGAPKRRGRPPKTDTVPAAATDAKPADPAPGAPAEAVAPDAPQISVNPENRTDSSDQLTHDTLRGALGRLAQKIGLGAAVAEVKTLVGGTIADVENTQEALRAVLDRMEARIAGGPAMTPLAAAAAAETPAATVEPAKAAAMTIDDVKAGIVAYAKKFGGDAAKADRAMLIGFGGKVDDMLPDQCEKAVTALRDALASNPLGRAIVGG